MKSNDVVALWSTGRQVPRGDVLKDSQGAMCGLSAHWDAEAAVMAEGRTWTATLRGMTFKEQAAWVVSLACEVGETAFILNAADPVAREYIHACLDIGRLRARLVCVDGTASIEAAVHREPADVDAVQGASADSSAQFLFMALMFMNTYENLEGKLTEGRRAARKHFQWCLVATPTVIEYTTTDPGDDSEYGAPDERGVRLRRENTK